MADVAVAGDRIAGIAASYAAPENGSIETIDARKHLVLPGFINAHYHSHDVLAKGTLEESSAGKLAPLCAAAAISAAVGGRSATRALLGALECLRSGA